MFLAIVSGVTLSALVMPRLSLGESTEAMDVSGVWTGWCQGCIARDFTLKLSQNGTDLTGTIQVMGSPSYGDGEKRIVNGTLSGRDVTFQSKGDTGVLFTVKLTMSRDGKKMSGTGEYRVSFGLRFTRVEH